MDLVPSSEVKNIIQKKLIENYTQPLIKSLIQLVPFGVGSAIDAAIVETLNKMEYNRKKAFFDELDSGELLLTDELIKSEDFLHCYMVTYKAMIMTKKEKKIELFAKLLKSYINSAEISLTEEFENELALVEPLNEIDIIILLKIDNFENTYSKGEMKPDKQAMANPYEIAPHWISDFEDVLIKELGITRSKLHRIFIKLEGLGLLERIIIIEKNHSKIERQFRPCYLTDTFFALKNRILV